MGWKGLGLKFKVFFRCMHDICSFNKEPIQHLFIVLSPHSSILCAGRRHRPHNVRQHALHRHPGGRLLILNVAKLPPGFQKLHMYMLDKAKQLQLRITRALCRMAFATIPARRRGKVWPSRSPPPGVRDFQRVPSVNTGATMRNLCLETGGGQTFSFCVQASLWGLSFCFLCFIQPY